MKTCYNKNIEEFDLAWPGRVARHDIVYKAPPADPMQYGMPLGNGDIGALVWCEDRKIIIAVNKCDLWDDADFGSFCNWNNEEEEFSTTLRHACRIIIDFGMPIFDTFYLSDFNGRLRLKDGCAQLSLTGPFGSMSAEIFVTYEGSILCARVTADFCEDDGIEITMERYGSRTFSHWYSFFRRDPNLGLTGTEAWTTDDDLFLSHKLTTGQFICALKVKGEGLEGGRRTSYMVTTKAEKCPKELFFYATVSSPIEKDQDTEYVINLLKEAKKKGFARLLSENEASWKQFWKTSFIETDDDYLDNLWHLAMYYSCAGQRGKYPGRFINSLWNWNRDVQPWNFYFHWNQQEVYWGLNAAGHHELCMSYLNYRFEGMEHSRKDAEQRFGVKDALFVADVCERRGYNSVLEKDNHTPVGEIAMSFWRQYQYTRDEDFLREKALPYMLGAAKFFVSLFVKGADGKYHAKGGNAYEGRTIFYDAITELAMANVLFSATLEAMEIVGVKDEAAHMFREILDNIAPIQLVESDDLIAVNADGTGKLCRGMFAGCTVPSSKVVAVGMPTEENREDEMVAHLIGQYVPQYGAESEKQAEKKASDSVEIVRSILYTPHVSAKPYSTVKRIVRAHPQANVSPVFPMEMVGLKDKGSDLFNALVATAMISRDAQSMGWDPMPIVLARLGRTEEVDAYIYDYPSEWQYYNNGFGHYGPNSGFVSDMISPFRRNMVGDAESSDRFWAESFPFRHMGLEPLGVFSATMNERLLQSHDGVIRIVPAYGKRDARFKLHAVGAFEVMCEVKTGIPVFVAIRSQKGGKLRLENPWTCAWLEGKKYTDELIMLDTESGRTYFFTPEEKGVFDFEAVHYSANEDCKVRSDRNAMLGLGRSF